MPLVRSLIIFKNFCYLLNIITTCKSNHPRDLFHYRENAKKIIRKDVQQNYAFVTLPKKEEATAAAMLGLP